MPEKAVADDIHGRFREIVSDPLNLFIRRVAEAGSVTDGLVCLHNGHRVPLSGDQSYYGDFSDILVINRGVHEPLEEFVFQELMPHLPDAPVMLELGAYWAHYSMWMLQRHPAGRAYMVEPDEAGLAAGQQNFARHGYVGVFEQGFVGAGMVTVDDFMCRHGIDRLTILHSDIQGFEVAMLDGAVAALTDRRIDYVFVSTHGEKLHRRTARRLKELGYRVDVNADWATYSTSHDGFILAVRPDLPRFIPKVPILGRQAINDSEPEALARYVARMANALNQSRPSSALLMPRSDAI